MNIQNTEIERYGAQPDEYDIGLDIFEEYINTYNPDTSEGWFKLALAIKFYIEIESGSESIDDSIPETPCMRRNIHSFGSIVSSESSCV
tara:strand:- start:1787 stop:2053 length:267 start_codon:yes stop_codon:yes gene_type:complete